MVVAARVCFEFYCWFITMLFIITLASGEMYAMYLSRLTFGNFSLSWQQNCVWVCVCSIYLQGKPEVCALSFHWITWYICSPLFVYKTSVLLRCMKLFSNKCAQELNYSYCFSEISSNASICYALTNFMVILAWGFILVFASNASLFGVLSPMAAPFQFHFPIIFGSKCIHYTA